MNNLELLTKAIKLQKPISFEYVTSNHVVGKRYGNPHAIFIHPSTNNMNIDIWKTGGVRTDETKQLPDWRQYRLEFISNVIVLEKEASFTMAQGYNPTSKQYAKVYVKI